jgi:hypothetical protein
VGDRRGDGVVEVAGAVDLAPALVDQGVVEQQDQPAFRRSVLDKLDDQAPPESVRRPFALPDPARHFHEEHEPDMRAWLAKIKQVR